MSSLHPSELDSTATDSVASSPRSDHHPGHDALPRVRFMCSFGGKILPRPHDNQLRYVGGDTRIAAVNRNSSFSSFIAKLSKLSGISNVTVKYQLPNEDLDALISVTTDEDLENMMEEYDRVAQNQNPRSARLRLFLFNKGEESRASSISSILDGSTNREQWFLDALNGGGPSGLERGRSEASSIVSEVPDYLFGLDNSDENPPREPKLRTKSILSENVSMSDPGSPAPVISSPFCSMPDLPPVKTKIETQPESFVEPTREYSINPVWQYPNHHYPAPQMQTMPVYYVPGPVHPGNAPVQQIQMQPQQYVPQYQQSPQMPVSYQPAGQIYGGGPMRPGHSQPVEQGRVVHEGMNQQMFYGMTNGGMVAAYPPQGMMMSSAEDNQSVGMDGKSGRVIQPS